MILFKFLNLEMQMANQSNWTNRSLSYLCRTFNNVQKGADYNSSEPVTQIGFLDYDLFPEDKEFYSKYMLLNVKNHRIYNDKFVLRVLSLRSIDEATEEDKAWHIDEWARLFKTTTWEELKMIAEKNDVYAEVANSMYKQNSDLTIRQMCEAREEARIHEEYVKNQFDLLHTQLKEQNTQLKEKDAQLEDKDAQLEEKDALINELRAELEKAKHSI